VKTRNLSDHLIQSSLNSKFLHKRWFYILAICIVCLTVLTIPGWNFSDDSGVKAVAAQTGSGWESTIYSPANPDWINPDWKHLGITSKVSVASDGSDGNGYAGSKNAISPDGRYVVFSSASTNLVPDDIEYGYEDIFLHDNQTGATERISLNSDEVAANGDSFYGVDITADGRFVIFCSQGSNLVPGDTNGKWDVFLRDRQLGTTRRLSVSSSGEQANGNSWLPRISEDGSIAVYTSAASNLVSGDTNNQWDIFAYEIASGQTTRISVSSTGAQGIGKSGDDKSPAVSADGRYVAFTSEASNLVAGDSNNFCDLNGDKIYAENCMDVFVRDRTAGTTERVSIGEDEQEGENFSMLPSISADGRYVAFFSGANNLVEGDTNTCQTLFYNTGPCPDVFVRDRQEGTTERVSVSSTGSQTTIDPIEYFQPPTISGDGNIVVFSSGDVTLAEGATNGYTQILAHNRTTHQTTLVSTSTSGTQGDDYSNTPADLSTTGRYVSFRSMAGNLVLQDLNFANDIFVRDREGWTYGIDGTVRDEIGNPMAGVIVGYGLGPQEFKATDTLGGYELYYMPVGTYTITAVLPGYIYQPLFHELNLTYTTVGVDFTMLPAAGIVYLPSVMR